MKSRALAPLVGQKGNSVVFAIIAMVSAGLLSLQFLMDMPSRVSPAIENLSARTSLHALRQNFLVYLSDIGTKTNTRNHPSNATAFACVGSACTQGTVYNLSLVDVDGNVVTNPSNASLGFDRRGLACNTYGAGDCVFRVLVSWQVDCAPNPSPCASPPIRYSAALEMFQVPGARTINLSEFQILPQDLQ